jgi:hypothetical protein
MKNFLFVLLASISVAACSQSTSSTKVLLVNPAETAPGIQQMLP